MKIEYNNYNNKGNGVVIVEISQSHIDMTLEITGYYEDRNKVILTSDHDFLSYYDKGRIGEIKWKDPGYCEGEVQLNKEQKEKFEEKLFGNMDELEEI